ncbi:unnamed protein product, partial [Polarella glacialis]
ESVPAPALATEELCADEGSDPMAAFCERLMARAQDRRSEELSRSFEEPEAAEVPPLDKMLAALDAEEAQERDFELLKHLLPDLAHKGERSMVLVGEDGQNPFITASVRVFQERCPEVDFVRLLGSHYETMTQAAAYRAAQDGHVEQLQQRSVDLATAERRSEDERRRLLREFRQRRLLLEGAPRALGVDMSQRNTKISKASPALPSSSSSTSTSSSAYSSWAVAPNGLRFPGLGEATASSGPEPCFAGPEMPHPPTARTAAARRQAQQDSEREARAREQAERLLRLKERRQQKERQQAIEAARLGVLPAGDWGPLGTMGAGAASQASAPHRS